MSVPHVAVSALTHQGVLRDHNEDSVVMGPWTACASVTDTPATLFFPIAAPLLVAVADGVGGHPAGDVASGMVAQELSRAGRTLTDEASVRAALDACNQSVYDAGMRDAERTGMGTTIAGIVVDETTVRVFNVGDSRVYAVDEHGLERLSTDDNPPLTPGQTHTSVLTQMLGGYAGDRRINSHVSSRQRADNCRYLVCTDGLSDVVSDDAIASVMARGRGAEAAYELWRMAMEAGGPDNITIAVVKPAEA
ncbi:MAG TPA: protein phosphatase 2C domain-containing protein [Nocardioidaceae bacterium]|nr:protein phosphatase 2C domain-containing protein [Nocardioidaceae bacterium]